MRLLKIIQTTLFFLFFSHLSNAQSQDIYRIKSPENSLYLEVSTKNTNRDGVKVFLKKYSTSSKQKWVITKNNRNYYTIKNLANNKVMSIYPYEINSDGNPLILNSPNSSDQQKWKISKNGAERVLISNVQNDKLLVPEKNSYGNLNKIILNRSMSNRKQSWILVSVNGNNNSSGYNFAGVYKNESSKLQMEIRNMGRNNFKAIFTGDCNDESLTGTINSSGVLIIPLRSNNNVRLEIRNQGTRFNVKITNIGQLSSRSYGKCNGGTIEGYYRKKQNITRGDFEGVFQLSYGNQQMEIVKSGYDSYKAIFTGNCKAETLSGKINRMGELEIPLRGGYNDKLFIRKNGNLFNVRITNKSIMNNACNGGSLEGNYYRRNIVKEDFSGKYRVRNGRQGLEIVKIGFDGYKAVFTGDCKAETLAGRINSRGILEIPLRGGYNDKLEISRQGNRIKVFITNKNVMNNACQGFSIEGYYEKQTWNDSNNSSNIYFSGRYQLDMQFVNLISLGANKYRAVFSGDCELTTKTGTVNNNGILEIPFVGENQMQKMMIRRRRNNSIEITNTSNSPMMGLCRGATLAGIYAKR